MLVPEDADDIFTLRRIIENGDSIIADTSRVVKQIKEYGRPDRGERVKVRVSLKTEEAQLDAAVDRLRITGTITMNWFQRALAIPFLSNPATR